MFEQIIAVEKKWPKKKKKDVRNASFFLYAKPLGNCRETDNKIESSHLSSCNAQNYYYYF